MSDEKGAEYMRRITPTDRLAVAALAVADVGVGVFLVAVGALPGMGVIHTVAGVVALLLAMPAAVAAISGTLPRVADEGVLVNVAVMVFIVLEVLFLPSNLAQRLGMATLLLAATVATVGLYLRLFGVLRLRRPIRGPTTTTPPTTTNEGATS